MREHALIIGHKVLLAGLPPAAPATDLQPVPVPELPGLSDAGVADRPIG